MSQIMRSAALLAMTMTVVLAGAFAVYIQILA